MTWILSIVVCGLILYVARLEHRWVTKMNDESEKAIQPHLEVLRAELKRMREARAVDATREGGGE